MNDMTEFGYVRAAAAAPAVALADPAANAQRIAAEFHQLAAEGASIVLFPELSVTGYTCEDLFFTRPLLDATRAALASLVRATSGTQAVLVVGAPWLLADGRLLNCAFVAARGRMVGAVPKSAHPNYAEFYEKRWFVSGADIAVTIDDETFGQFPLTTNQLFEVGQTRFAIEICEDLWAPDPIGNRHALAGADLILNPSASTDLVGKADYRRDLVRMTSGTRICGYLFASSGPTESTKDVVFGGHLIAAENALLLGESERFALDGTRLIVDFDREKLRHDRAVNNTFAAAARPPPYSCIDTGVTPAPIDCAYTKLPAASVRSGGRTRVRRARAGNSLDSGDRPRAPADRCPHRNAGHRAIGRARFDAGIPRLSRCARETGSTGKRFACADDAWPGNQRGQR